MHDFSRLVRPQLPRSMSAWRNFADVYQKLGSPLRPSQCDVEIFRQCLPTGGRILLLGVTPELSTLGGELVVVDNSARMLAEVWPGDNGTRRAILADWTELPFADCEFDAVIGDGSINSAPEHMEKVLDEAVRVIRPDARAIFRAFCAPSSPESLAAIEDDVAAGWNGNVHALKWRIAMVLAASRRHATVPVSEILAAFDAMFPDRDKLAARCGWSLDEIATIDAYVGADHKLGFPTLESLLPLLRSRFADVTVLSAAGYPLAERCPTIACARPRGK